MTVHPIIFSAAMVQALLAGRKTQTRRLASSPLARVKPNDLLYVREAVARRYFDDGRPAYRADWTGQSADVVKEPRWTPAIHMPRECSRLTLLVTGVRLEPLTSISRQDARAEGLAYLAPMWGVIGNPKSWHRDARASFRALWESLHGAGSWEANPEVVALTFKVLRHNVDKLDEVMTDALDRLLKGEAKVDDVRQFGEGWAATVDGLPLVIQ